MDNVFVDTDIILDLLSFREPFYIHAASLFSLADQKKLKINVSSLSFSNLHYILSKQHSPDQSRKKLLKFKTLVTVLPVVELALASDFRDFEDGIQYYAALEQGIKVILTKNLRDFKKRKFPS